MLSKKCNMDLEFSGVDFPKTAYLDTVQLTQGWNISL